MPFFTAPCAVKATLRAGTGHAGLVDPDDDSRHSAALLKMLWVRGSVVLAAVALLVGHVLQPEGVVGSATYLGAVGGAAAMAWIGALRRPRGPSGIPLLIAGGITANLIGELIWYSYVWAGFEPDVTVADVGYLLAYVGLAAALVRGTLIHTGNGSRVDPESIIDALTIIVLSVLVFWDLSIAAIVGETTVSGFTRFVWATYPVLDAILLALVVRALMTKRSRSTIGLAFACGVFCWLIADLGYLLTVSETILPFLDAGWMLGAMLMTISAWRRPVAEADPGTVDARPGRPLARLTIATVPLLIPLSLHFVEDARGGESNISATIVCVALLLGLSFARSALLLRSESRAQTEARASRDAALEASRAKSAFLATMSHEIRTPMNGVIGLTSLLQLTTLDERQRQYVDGVHHAGEALLSIINDILDFSKNEAGRLELDVIDFTLAQVVEEAAELVADPARSKGLELLAYCSPELPMTLRGDPSRLRQVLLNLASNAVKFTHTGEVVVRAFLESESNDGAVVRFVVSDTGMGLDNTDRRRLFEPFSQADSSTTRRFGGTGLGLAICLQLVTAMGGELGVESELGRGSTFWFTLPLQRAAETPTAPVRSTAELAGLRALIVDDNHTNRLILRDQLTAWGLHPDVTPDGASALNLLEAAAGTAAPYSVALLDLCMPGMDGLELAAHISRRPALAGIELLLLTSVPDVSAEEARANGISVRLTKPVHMSRLHLALQEASRGRNASPQEPLTQVTTPEPGHRGHVLVVDDHQVNQLVAVAILEYLGFTTEVAVNGLEALESYARSPFAAILMDCRMPEMDGYAATQEIRRIEDGGPRTPIIAMTAGVGDSERERCLLAGMDDYVPKPVTLDDVDAKMSHWLPITIS